MGLAMSSNSKRLGKLRDVLARLRDETFQKITPSRSGSGSFLLAQR
jgi:hypothetical protein